MPAVHVPAGATPPEVLMRLMFVTRSSSRPGALFSWAITSTSSQGMVPSLTTFWLTLPRTVEPSRSDVHRGPA